MSEAQPLSRITLLDGGMGRELMRMGAPFRQPEWSALALMQTPGLVKKAHESFAAAGSDILTTSNYAVVPAHIGEERFLTQGAALTKRSGQCANEIAALFNCRVAGSIPPLFGSYRPDLFIPERAPDILNIIIDALSPHIDLWLVETVSSVAEAEAAAQALNNDDRPLWISFTLLDSEHGEGHPPQLRSGEKVADAAAVAAELGAAAVLFNCSQPETMAAAVFSAIQELRDRYADIEVGVYANAFPAQQKDAQANLDLDEIREDLGPSDYAEFAAAWCRLGATIIGGCCGIGPEHIAALKKRYKP
jgi:S-methylmethionine-dependent homocysteine/selenocysteine methylase